MTQRKRIQKVNLDKEMKKLKFLEMNWKSY